VHFFVKGILHLKWNAIKKKIISLDNFSEISYLEGKKEDKVNPLNHFVELSERESFLLLQ